MEKLKKFGPLLYEMLDAIFIRKSFKKEIHRYRKDIGIQNGGFKSNEMYVDWIKGKYSEFMDIRSAGVKLATASKLPIHMAVWMEAYLVLGKKYKIFDGTIPMEELRDSDTRGFDDKSDLNCALESDPDFQCMNIKVYSGASERSINAFVHNNYYIIEKFLNKFDNKIKPLRKKRVTKRNSEIYQFYKKGWINRYGLETKAGKNVLPQDIQDMDIDMRRKIIGLEITRRK